SQIERLGFPAGSLNGGELESPQVRRLDLRVAKRLRLGAYQGELSFVVQNLGPAYPDFIAGFHFRRQAYLMLRLEN
ncbi:MAG: hypothetical protein OEW36_05065, partial [Hylemonella sp.]|nr:hypothetical protein [Hylemonella sp.]